MNLFGDICAQLTYIIWMGICHWGDDPQDAIEQNVEIPIWYPICYSLQTSSCLLSKCNCSLNFFLTNKSSVVFHPIRTNHCVDSKWIVCVCVFEWATESLLRESERVLIHRQYCSRVSICRVKYINRLQQMFMTGHFHIWAIF